MDEQIPINYFYHSMINQKGLFLHSKQLDPFQTNEIIVFSMFIYQFIMFISIPILIIFVEKPNSKREFTLFYFIFQHLYIPVFSWVNLIFFHPVLSLNHLLFSLLSLIKSKDFFHFFENYCCCAMKMCLYLEVIYFTFDF